MKKIVWMGLLFVMTIGLIFTLMGQSGSYSDFSDVERSQGNVFQAGTWENPKAITAFSFQGLTPAVIGVVNEGAHTVALTVPFGTNVTALVPTIVITGTSVNPLSEVANNFTTPQTYTVTAADATTQDYIVTVTIDVVAVPPAPDDTTAPVITLNGDAIVNLTVGASYTDAGATASDNVDGDITANIVVGGDTVDTSTVGTYIITYNVSDAAGNPATEVTRTVIVSEEESDPDTTLPVITLIGDETVNLTVGDSYTDAGSTASDNVDGNLTSSIVTGGTFVDTSTAGTYTITYDVQDAAGNHATQVVRTIIVSVAPMPE